MLTPEELQEIRKKDPTSHPNYLNAIQEHNTLRAELDKWGIPDVLEEVLSYPMVRSLDVLPNDKHLFYPTRFRVEPRYKTEKSRDPHLTRAIYDQEPTLGENGEWDSSVRIEVRNRRQYCSRYLEEIWTVNFKPSRLLMIAGEEVTFAGFVTQTGGVDLDRVREAVERAKKNPMTHDPFSAYRGVSNPSVIRY